MKGRSGITYDGLACQRQLQLPEDLMLVSLSLKAIVGTTPEVPLLGSRSIQELGALELEYETERICRELIVFRSQTPPVFRNKPHSPRTRGFEHLPDWMLVARIMRSIEPSQFLEDLSWRKDKSACANAISKLEVISRLIGFLFEISDRHEISIADRAAEVQALKPSAHLSFLRSVPSVRVGTLSDTESSGHQRQPGVKPDHQTDAGG
jgi:hypothetical protein